MIETTPNYKHTAYNALSNNYDDGAVSGVANSWEGYASSGDIILDSAGGIAGKFIPKITGTTPLIITNTASAVDDALIKTNLYWNLTAKPSITSGVKNNVNTVSSIKNGINSPSSYKIMDNVSDGLNSYLPGIPEVSVAGSVGVAIEKSINYESTIEDFHKTKELLTETIPNNVKEYFKDGESDDSK